MQIFEVTFSAVILCFFYFSRTVIDTQILQRDLHRKPKDLRWLLNFLPIFYSRIQPMVNTGEKILKSSEAKFMKKLSAQSFWRRSRCKNQIWAIYYHSKKNTPQNYRLKKWSEQKTLTRPPWQELVRGYIVLKYANSILRLFYARLYDILYFSQCSFRPHLRPTRDFEPVLRFLVRSHRRISCSFRSLLMLQLAVKRLTHCPFRFQAPLDFELFSGPVWRTR